MPLSTKLDGSAGGLRALLRTILDGRAEAIVAYDTDLRVTEWTAVTARNTGIARADALGRSILDLFPYVRGTAVEEEYRRSLAGETVDARERPWSASGTERPRCFDVTYHPVRDDDGRIIGGVVLTVDVTERRESEDALAAERRLLRAILDTAPHALVAVDRDCRIMEWNACSERKTGMRRALVLGRHLLDVMPDLAGTEMEGDYHRAIAGEPGHIRDRWYAVPGRESRCYDVIFAPMHDGRGAVTGAIMLAQDVTERVRAQVDRERVIADLDAARDRAVRASQAKSAMLAGLSHELRTPLGAVLGFAQLLRDGRAGALTEAQIEYVDDVLTGASYLLRVVNDALDLARVEAGVVEMHPEQIDLEELIAQAIGTIAPLAAAHGITITAQFPPDKPRLVADAGRVRQVLLNYLSNAVKYSHSGDAVVVEVAAAANSSVRLTVRDNGPGIPPDEMGRLFVEFQRLGADRDVPGSGLGLAITKRLVEAMGGLVAAESVRGVGSAFHAVLPSEPLR